MVPLPWGDPATRVPGPKSQKDRHDPPPCWVPGGRKRNVLDPMHFEGVGTGPPCGEPEAFQPLQLALFLVSAVSLLVWENLANDAFDDETGVDINKPHSVVCAVAERHKPNWCFMKLAHTYPAGPSYPASCILQTFSHQSFHLLFEPSQLTHCTLHFLLSCPMCIDFFYK